MHPDCYSRLEQIDKKNNLRVMAFGKQVKSTRVNHDWNKARRVTASISLEDLIEKEGSIVTRGQCHSQAASAC